MSRIDLYGAILRALAPGAHHDLARQIEFLREENRILRSRLPGRVVVTHGERARLVRLGRPIGRAMQGLLSIVSPRTFARWLGAAEQAPRLARTAARPPGRPPIGNALSDLIRRMARETDWGYTRIHHELRRLGCGEVSRSTVASVVRSVRGAGGAPDSGGSWDRFVRSHAESLWACDFISRKVMTRRGLVEHFVLFFIHVASRRVVISPATARPDSAWMVEQARAFAAVVAPESVRSETGSDLRAELPSNANAAAEATPRSRVDGQTGTTAEPPPLRLLRDNDRKFSRDFDEMLRTAGIVPHPLPIQSPNLNAYAERWVQTVKHECLNHFVVFGAAHLDHLMREFVEYYHHHRAHQGLGGRTVVDASASLAGPPGSAGGIRHCETLGGRLCWYEQERRAA